MNSTNSRNLINEWSMNWAQFKDPVSHICLAGAVVAAWSLIQEVAGSNNLFKIYNIIVTKVNEFSENI